MCGQSGAVLPGEDCSPGRYLSQYSGHPPQGLRTSALERVRVTSRSQVGYNFRVLWGTGGLHYSLDYEPINPFICKTLPLPKTPVAIIGSTVEASGRKGGDSPSSPRGEVRRCLE